MSDDIQRSLGRIEGKQDQILEEQKKASQERKEIFQQMEAIKRKQEMAEKERAAMSERLKTVESNTTDFNKWKERAIGAVMLISLMAALVGGGLAVSWHKIVDLLRGVVM